MTSLKAFLIIVACQVVVAGCDSEDPGKPRYYAGQGTSFTYTRTDKNADGTTITGSDTTITAVVIEGVHHYEGKDTVITVVEGNFDTVRMAYEPNGDVSVYGGLNFGGFPNPFADTLPKWWKLPVASKGEVPIVSMDLNFSIDFPPIVITLKKIVGVADYKTTEDIIVNGDRLTSSKVEVAFTLTASLSGLPSTLNFTRTYWFCDKIGYFTQVDVQNDDLLVFPLPKYIQTLETYTVVR
jgi:hypothetical protein